MYQKLFILATIALSAVTAHPGSHVTNLAAAAPASTFKFSEAFPEPFVIPTAKPEWLELIKNVNITKAPVYKPATGQSPQPEVAGQDPYCDWTFTGCFGKEDLHQCPKGQFSVTYDDGPSEFSPKLYDYLDKVNVKATFFMVGGQVVSFPDHTLRAYKAGHELAMHTWSHNYMTTLTNEQIVAELKWNELAIKEVTGVSPKFFRPPYGDIDNRVRDVARALGFIPVIWTHDTNDWAHANDPKGHPQSWVTGNVTQWAKEASSATHGGISLEHDLYKETVDVGIKIIPTLQEVYKLVPSGECNGVSPYKDNATVPVPSAASSAAPSASASPVASVKPAASPAISPSTIEAASVTGSGGASSFAGASALSLGIAAVAAVAML